MGACKQARMWGGAPAPVLPCLWGLLFPGAAHKQLKMVLKRKCSAPNRQLHPVLLHFNANNATHCSSRLDS